MPDDPDLIDKAEAEFDRLIIVCRQSGLNYHQILRILLIKSQDVFMKSEVEYYQKQSG